MIRTRLNTALMALVIGFAFTHGPTQAEAGRNVTFVVTPKNEIQARAIDRGLRAATRFQERVNAARIDQRGSGNRAELSQNGSGNQVGVFQRGTGHSATVSQDGNRNTLGVFQFGRNTSTNTSQTGNGKSELIFQGGW